MTKTNNQEEFLTQEADEMDLAALYDKVDLAQQEGRPQEEIDVLMGAFKAASNRRHLETGEGTAYVTKLPTAGRSAVDGAEPQRPVNSRTRRINLTAGRIREDHGSPLSHESPIQR